MSMPTTYARVFLEILDSSIAEDWQVRHVFEDFLKLAGPGGEVDITREALSRRLNVPLDVLNRAIGVLEAPDTKSRDKAAQGRRLLRLDEHRDWGWRITNWAKYDGIRTRADSATRRMRHYYRHKGEDQAGEGGDTSPTPPPESNPIPIPYSERTVTECNAPSLQPHPVELPGSFPKTEQEAVAQTSGSQIPNEFTVATWQHAMGRNGRDAKGQPILRWAYYVAAMWRFEQNRQHERKETNANGRSNPRTPASRNAGTYNESIPAGYYDAAIFRSHAENPPG